MNESETPGREAGRGDPTLLDWLRRVRSGQPGPGLSCWTRLVFFLFLGLVMGTGFDAFHVFTKTASYCNIPKIPGLDVAIYVPFEFMAAGALVGMVRPVWDSRFGGPKSRLSVWAAIGGLLFLSAAWAGSGAISRICWVGANVPDPPVCTGDPNNFFFIVLLSAGGAFWYWLDRTTEGIVVAFFTGGMGVGIELALIHLSKTYGYTHGDLFGVPSWLPGLYFIAAGSIGNFGRFLKQPTGQIPKE